MLRISPLSLMFNDFYTEKSDLEMDRGLVLHNISTNFIFTYFYYTNSVIASFIEFYSFVTLVVSGHIVAENIRSSCLFPPSRMLPNAYNRPLNFLSVRGVLLRRH